MFNLSAMVVIRFAVQTLKTTTAAAILLPSCKVFLACGTTPAAAAEAVGNDYNYVVLYIYKYYYSSLCTKTQSAHDITFL